MFGIYFNEYYFEGDLSTSVEKFKNITGNSENLDKEVKTYSQIVTADTKTNVKDDKTYNNNLLISSASIIYDRDDDLGRFIYINDNKNLNDKIVTDKIIMKSEHFIVLESQDGSGKQIIEPVRISILN